MSKRDAFWDSVPTDDEGNILWPDDTGEREELARAMFGAKVIGALESVLEDHLETVGGRPPKAGAPDYEEEAPRREVFASLSPVQRAEVERLLRRACFGTLYWILVKLEHFPMGDVDFTVKPFFEDGRECPPVGIEKMELHHLYFDWRKQFADHIDGLADD